MRSATDSVLERPLPHNLDAERAVLGAVLLCLVLFFPAGITGFVRTVAARRRAAQRPA